MMQFVAEHYWSLWSLPAGLILAVIIRAFMEYY